MKKLLGISTAAIVALSGPALADGFYNIYGPQGDKWGEITFQETVGENTVWTLPSEDADATFFIKNPTGGQDGWSQAYYDGYYTIDVGDMDPEPCSYAINDGYGGVSEQWGTARFRFTGADEFVMQTWECDSQTMQWEATAKYAWGESNEDVVVPVAATLGLQSDQIPLSYDDPAYTVQGLDKNPAIYLKVDFSDGTSQDNDYQKFEAANIVFDDVSGDPNDIIQINYWDIDSNNPGLGKFAAQLTSTGNGVGTAQLFVSFRDAPHVRAAVTATVVSAAQTQSHMKTPVNVVLGLQSDRIPLSYDDPAYTVDGLDKNPAIYLDVDFSDGTSEGYDYKKFQAANIVFDDVSGDPNDIIQINYWDIDDNNPGAGKYAAQLTSTGNGVGTAQLYVSFRNAPHVRAAVTATVVSALAQLKSPISAELGLQSYTLPLDSNDPAHTVSGLDLYPAIYVSTRFADGTSYDYDYHKDFADNVIIDDVSGDPFDLIEIVDWPIDNNDESAGNFAGQLTSTGRGVGFAELIVRFKNAPGVVSTVAVEVTSGAN